MNAYEQGKEMRDAALNGQDVAALTFVVMAQSEQFDDVTITEHADVFAQWAENVSYAAKTIVRYAGLLYRCLQAHTSQADWKPDKTASLWVKIGNPAEEWPQWVPWIGGMDLYMTGAKVTHSGKRWISEIDNNVWEPGVHGWKEAK